MSILILAGSAVLLYAAWRYACAGRRRIAEAHAALLAAQAWSEDANLAYMHACELAEDGRAMRMEFNTEGGVEL